MEDSQAKQELYQRLQKYPPFYTLQDHQESRQRQKTYWAEIVHQHFKKSKMIESSISEITGLFQDNTGSIPKRMNKEEIKEILDQMAQLGSIEWKGVENFSINLVSPFELADAIYTWAKEKKLIGYTETLKGISQGELTDQKYKFHDLPQEQILKACQILEETGRADVYELDGMFSVKFK